MPLKPIAWQNRAAAWARPGLGTVRADAVIPACGGQDRSLIPVNTTGQLESASQYRWTIQSCACSRGMYSCRITLGSVPQSWAAASSSCSLPNTVVPPTTGACRRTQASRFLATSGNDAWPAKLARAADVEGKADAGAGTPCSWHSSYSPCLLASFLGSAGGTSGSRKCADSRLAFSASRTAASSSVGTASVRRPILAPIAISPSTSSSGFSRPVVGQTKESRQYRDRAAGVNESSVMA